MCERARIKALCNWILHCMSYGSLKLWMLLDIVEGEDIAEEFWCFKFE